MKLPSSAVCQKTFDNVAAMMATADFLDHELTGRRFDPIKMVQLRYKECREDEEDMVLLYGVDGQHTYRSLTELVLRRLNDCKSALTKSLESPND